MIAEYFAQTYLPAQGIGTFGTDLFASQIPDAPDNCIVCFDEPGIPQDYFQAYASDAMGLLVITRGSYQWAKDKIWQIHWNIVGLNEIDLPDYRLKVVQIQSLPGQIENDSKGRREFTAHYDVLVNSKNDTHRQPIIQ